MGKKNAGKIKNKEYCFGFSKRGTVTTATIAAATGIIVFLLCRQELLIEGALVIFLAVEFVACLTRGLFYPLIAVFLGVPIVYGCVARSQTDVWLTSPVFWLVLLFLSVGALLPVAVRSKRNAQTQSLLCNELLHTVAHDLRSPLGAMMSAVTYLQDNPAEEKEQQQILQTLRYEIQGLLYTVENRLLFTRIHNEPVPFFLDEEIIEEIVSEAVQKFCTAFPEQHVHISVPQEPLILKMNAVMMEQTIQNLLEVVVRYLPDGSQPCLLVFCEQNAVVFRFCCSSGSQIRCCHCGLGIPDYHKIFDKHLPHRMETGLDLSMLVAQSHYGRLLCGADPSSGAVFEMILPLQH